MLISILGSLPLAEKSRLIELDDDDTHTQCSHRDTVNAIFVKTYINIKEKLNLSPLIPSTRYIITAPKFCFQNLLTDLLIGCQINRVRLYM